MIDADECIHGLAAESCTICNGADARERSVVKGGGNSGGSRPAHDWSAVVSVRGESYGLYPSDGVVYVFGSGHLIHHDVTCGMGNQTPEARRVQIPDPDGGLYQRLIRQRADAGLENVDGNPVVGTCLFCTLIPLPDMPPVDITIEGAQPYPD